MNTRIWLCLALSTAALPASAGAAVVTYVASGDVTSITARTNPFPAGLASAGVGEVAEIRVTVETSAGSDADADPNRGQFTMPAGSYSAEMRVGSSSTPLPNTAPLVMIVTNDLAVGPNFRDLIEFNFGDAASGFFGPSLTSLTLVFNGTAYGSDAVPLSLTGTIRPTGSNFSYVSYQNGVTGATTASVIGGRVTSLAFIPAPGSAGVLLVAGVAAMRRRRS